MTRLGNGYLSSCEEKKPVKSCKIEEENTAGALSGAQRSYYPKLNPSLDPMSV